MSFSHCSSGLYSYRVNVTHTWTKAFLINCYNLSWFRRGSISCPVWFTFGTLCSERSINGIEWINVILHELCVRLFQSCVSLHPQTGTEKRSHCDKISFCAAQHKSTGFLLSEGNVHAGLQHGHMNESRKINNRTLTDTLKLWRWRQRLQWHFLPCVCVNRHLTPNVSTYSVDLHSQV